MIPAFGRKYTEERRGRAKKEVKRGEEQKRKERIRKMRSGKEERKGEENSNGIYRKDEGEEER